MRATAGGWHALKSSSPRARIDDQPGLDSGLGGVSGRRLLCALCGRLITSDAHRIEVAGSHSHDRTNPYGIRFHFWCFDAAPGARTAGRPTSEHTWFAGHAWSFALCGGCGEHLGWLFEGEAPARFFALICDRLEVDESSPPAS
jgi:hypothetical protein